MRRFAHAASLLAVFILLTAMPVWAQEEQFGPENSGVGWVVRWLNFAIVFAAIVYFTVKKGRPYFRQNAQDIAEKIAEGARAREAAEQRRREIDAKRAGLDKEIQEMRAAAKRDSEAEAKRLRAMAREEAMKIEQASQAEMAAAERAGWLELKALTARLVVERAEALLKQELSAEKDAGLVRTFVEEVGGRPN
jgi:F-type H+-transporting ATPase subunit b